MTVGERIRYYRKNAGLRQEDVAVKAHTTKQTIQRYECGVITNIPAEKLELIAHALGVRPEMLMGWTKTDTTKAVKIPVLGAVVAGVPMEAVENIIGYEEISPAMAAQGDYFALRVKGQSMEPVLSDGDTIVIRKQPDVESGDIAIVLVGGNEATVKRVKKAVEGITLIGDNAMVYSPHFYSNKEIESLPVQIIGKVVEQRRRV